MKRLKEQFAVRIVKRENRFSFTDSLCPSNGGISGLRVCGYAGGIHSDRGAM